MVSGHSKPHSNLKLQNARVPCRLVHLRMIRTKSDFLRCSGRVESIIDLQRGISQRKRAMPVASSISSNARARCLSKSAKKRDLRSDEAEQKQCWMSNVLP